MVGSAVIVEAGTIIVLFLAVSNILLVCLLIVITSFYNLLLPLIIDEGGKGLFIIKR